MFIDADYERLMEKTEELLGEAIRRRELLEAIYEEIQREAAARKQAQEAIHDNEPSDCESADTGRTDILGGVRIGAAGLALIIMALALFQSSWLAAAYWALVLINWCVIGLKD